VDPEFGKGVHFVEKVEDQKKTKTEAEWVKKAAISL